MTLGKLLAGERERAGLDLEQFAARIGVAKSQVWSWENEVYQPKTVNLKKIAKALRIRFATLVAAAAESRYRE